MKVIKEGTGQQGWSIEAECTGRGNGNGGCGAVLLVEEGDLFKTTSHARDETTTYVTFKCSQCNVLTDIKDGIVPSHIYRKLKTRNPNSSLGRDNSEK